MTKGEIRFLDAARIYSRANSALGVDSEFDIDYIDGWVTFKKNGRLEKKMRNWDFEDLVHSQDKRVKKAKRVEMIESRLERTIGDEALNALKEGRALLHIWRRTCPYNQWVEDKGGETLWHSGDRNRISYTHFKKVRDSKDLIGMSLNPNEIGMSDHSLYKLELDLKQY